MAELGYLPEITNEDTAMKYAVDCYNDAKGVWDLGHKEDREEFDTFTDYYADHLDCMLSAEDMELMMSFPSVVEFISEKK